jgi:FlaA1/EpsC-like NDP-sugar epimerase
MRNYYKRVVKYALVDILVVLAAYAGAISAWALETTPDYLSSLRVTIVVAFAMVAMLYTFGVYQRIWSRTSGHGIMVIINAVLAATSIIIPFVLISQQNPLPVPIILLGNLLCLIGFVAIRYRSRLASSFLWRWKAVIRREFPKQHTRVLIIGAGESGQALAWRLKHRFNDRAYEIVGFIDDDPEMQNMYVEGCRIIGTRKDILHIADTRNIDLIVVAIHNISGPDFREILTVCESTKALIKVVPDLQELVNAKQTTALLRDVQAEDLIGRSMVTRHEAVDLTPVTNKVILITGAAGSIGSELSRQIMLYAPTKAILMDNNESGLHDLITELRSKHPEIDLVPALVDITIRSAVRTVFEKHHPQIVFHAAAYKHVPMLEYYPREALRVNIGGTRNLAELARDFNVERFVLISTDKAVNPSNIMGATKRVCELMLHALSQQANCHTLFASVRFGNVLGSRGSVVPTFNHQIDSGGPVTVTHQDMTRYFMSIPEAVNLIIHAACLTNGNDIYVLRMGEVVRIVELAERMIRLRGLRPYKDIEIKFTGIRPGEKMHEELFHETEKPDETTHPNILKVDTWSERTVSAEFWENLDQLVHDLPEHQTNIIGKLFQLICDPETTMVAEEEHTDTNIQVV